MNKKQLKDLKSILRSLELNSMVFSEIQRSVEKEQTILENRQANYEFKGTDYWDDKAMDLDERILAAEEESESLQEIESGLHNLIDLLRFKLEKIETDKYNADLIPATQATYKSDAQINEMRDPLFEEIAKLVVTSGVGSTSGIQRRYSIGYNRAGKIMDQLEHYGVVGPSLGGKPRQVLMDMYGLQELLNTLNQ